MAAAAVSAANIDATTTFMVIKTNTAAEPAVAPAEAASLYQAFQVDAKGFKLNGGHFIDES